MVWLSSEVDSNVYSSNVPLKIYKTYIVLSIWEPQALIFASSCIPVQSVTQEGGEKWSYCLKTHGRVMSWSWQMCVTCNTLAKYETLLYSFNIAMHYPCHVFYKDVAYFSVIYDTSPTEDATPPTMVWKRSLQVSVIRIEIYQSTYNSELASQRGTYQLLLASSNHIMNSSTKVNNSQAHKLLTYIF